jgi:hypothetical protein
MASKRSGLTKSTNARRNTKAGRKRMSAGSFGLPAQKKYRIDDPAHARNALGRVAQHGTPAQKAQVRKRVAAKYPSVKVGGAKSRARKGK